MFTYVVEHMEEDELGEQTLPEWVGLEYMHMRTLAGEPSHVFFTHLSASSSSALSAILASSNTLSESSAQIFQESILDIMKKRNVPIHKVCLLDPKAEQELSPEDGSDDAFRWFLFGGILGDDPPRDRTAELRTLGFPTRHLGNIQMTTDTALGVTKKVVEDKIELQDILYVDYPTIKFNAKESVEMPFRYIAVNNEPLLPPGMRDLLYKDLDKGFDF